MPCGATLRTEAVAGGSDAGAPRDPECAGGRPVVCNRRGTCNRAGLLIHQLCCDCATMTQKNPYLDDDGKPVLQSSFCAFLDVLGFASHIDLSFKTGDGAIALERFYEVFTQQLKMILNPKTDQYSRWEIKVFTDNIVLGYPRPSWHSEPEFADIIRKIGLYQLQMTLENFFIRGGLAVGPLFMDETTAFGPALLESHALESKRAREPRVILSRDSIDVLNQHIGFYHPKISAPQNRLVFKDPDGEIFINYLDHIIVPGPPDGRDVVDIETLTKHRDVVVQNLDEHQGNPLVWAKYRWVATYHNIFVQECVQWGGCSNDLAIDSHHLSIGPKRLQHEDTEDAT